MGRANLRRVLLIPGLALGSIAMSWASGSAHQRVDYGRLVPALRGEMPRQVPDFPFAAYPFETRPMFDIFRWRSFAALRGSTSLAFALQSPLPQPRTATDRPRSFPDSGSTMPQATPVAP
jgi:hypothetical protein